MNERAVRLAVEEARTADLAAAVFRQGHVARLAAHMKGTQPAEGSRGVLYLGGAEHMREHQRWRDGVRIKPLTRGKLADLAEAAGLSAQPSSV